MAIGVGDEGEKGQVHARATQNAPAQGREKIRKGMNEVSG